MKIHVSEGKTLERLLERRKRHWSQTSRFDIGEVLKEILEWANRFVPSESGSIILDDPMLKLSGRLSAEKFYFAACFGTRSEKLAGSPLPEAKGVFLEAYRSGRPYICADVSKDRQFCSKIDSDTGFGSKSIICAPIKIETSTIGVIELINRKGDVNFSQSDLDLLEIFAGYTATIIQNSLIARRFEEMSIRDDLTGLYNDRFFYRTLDGEAERVMASGGDASLIFFDLDRFKEVNDNHGHLAGSAVLREVAGIVQEVLGMPTAIAARYGGDEFVIVLPDMDQQTAAGYAEKIRAKIASHVFLKEKSASGAPAVSIKGVITCSIGVASMAENVILGKSAKDAVETLIKASDTAMYRAKEHGKNQVCLATGRRKNI